MYQCLIVASHINSPHKSLCATLNIFTLMTVTRGSKIHTKHTVTFPQGQWLRKRATMLRSTYMTHHVSPNASVLPCQYHSTHVSYSLTLLRTCYQNDKQAKAGNLQTKQCSFEYRGAMNRKVLSRSVFLFTLQMFKHQDVTKNKN
jgi:hypothetical protein